MTHDDLHDLLHAQVDDLTLTGRPDLADRAWLAGRAARRRRVLAVVGGAAVASVAVVGTVTVLGYRSSGPVPTGPPASSTAAPTPSSSGGSTPLPDPTSRRRDTSYEGAAVFFAPTVAQEAVLPEMTVGRPPLPAEIDLAVDATPVESDPVRSVVAAYAVLDDTGVQRVLLLVGDGTYRTLDTSRLAPLADGGGNAVLVTGGSMLSPTGRWLMFPQDGHLEVYDLATGEWRRVDTGDDDTRHATWANDTQVYLQPTPDGGNGPVYDVETRSSSGRADLPSGQGVDLGEATRYGRWRTGPEGIAQSWSSGTGLGPGGQGDVPRGALPDPEVLVVERGTRPATLLAFVGEEPRWKQCCPVVGWADSDTVLYESQGADPRIIAWDVGTHRFEDVARIVGVRAGEQYFVGSYARYWR